jgi:hypothetical protein
MEARWTGMKACQHVPAGASTSQLLTTNSKTDLAIRSKSLIINELVPKKGLEPPHPCEYVDLNHARLPIPPLRHETQIQRFPPDRQHLRVSQNEPAVSNPTGVGG